MKPLQTRKDSFEQFVFNQFWDSYDKKVDRPKCERKWNRLKISDRTLIMIHIPEYVKSTPDKMYRKNPATYLKNESWLNEIIVKKNGQSEYSYDEVVRIHSDYKDPRVMDNFECIGNKIWKLK